MLRTNDSWSSFFLRIFLGVVFFAHGAQKALGWFGGYGLSATLGMFTGKMHIPFVFACLAVAAEFLGSLGLLTGFLTRLAAFGIGTHMVVAVLLIHRFNGFFMNWDGKKMGEGFEYHLLVIGICLALLAAGGGKFSLDRLLSKNE